MSTTRGHNGIHHDQNQRRRTLHDLKEQITSSDMESEFFCTHLVESLCAGPSRAPTCSRSPRCTGGRGASGSSCSTRPATPGLAKHRRRSARGSHRQDHRNDRGKRTSATPTRRGCACRDISSLLTPASDPPHGEAPRRTRWCGSDTACPSCRRVRRAAVEDARERAPGDDHPCRGASSPSLDVRG